MSDSFKQYVKILGRGQRSGRSLSRDEAYKAFCLLLSGRCTPEQRGAFLMLLRVREETPEELAGFLTATREFSVCEMGQIEADIDIGCYAGKRRHLPWFLLSVLALAQHGYRIFMHGTQEPDSKRLYLNIVMEGLGLPVASTPLHAANLLDQDGFAYLGLDKINPALDNLIQLREQLGLRSCANTLARMLKPTSGSSSFQGVFHRHVDEKHATIGQLLDEPNLLCFRGEGGEVELNPEREVISFRVQGQQVIKEVVPALLEQWQIKSKKLDISILAHVYTTGGGGAYAQAAVTGTMALMLSAINNNTWAESLHNAQNIWQKRDKTAFIKHTISTTKNAREQQCVHHFH
jgi:anthranilate phosphoribosyltransferase